MKAISRSIEARILAVAGICLLAVGLTGAFSLAMVWHTVNNFEHTSDTSLAYRYGTLEMTVKFKEQVQEWKNVLLRGKDAQRFERHWKGFQESEKRVQELGAKLAGSIEQPKAKDLMVRFVAAHEKMGAAYRKGLDEFKNANFDAAVGDKAVSGMDRVPTQLLEEAEKVIGEDADRAMQSGFERSRRLTVSASAIIAALLLTALALLFFQVRTRIARPLSMATKAIESLARGEIGERVQVSSEDEIGRLQRATQQMSDTLSGFADAQRDMHRKHVELGLVDERLPEGQLQGIYGEMAKLANDLVSAHLAVCAQVVATTSQYAEGDLSSDLARLPGQQARITSAVDGIKSNLLAMNEQIQALAQAAARGDFSVRGDEARFKHAFRDMVVALNTLMKTADGGLTDVASVLHALARGDLTARITADHQGTFGKLKDDANATVDKLTEIVGSIKDSTGSINVACKEIAAGNSDLSSRTEEQASSLEETASSMEELTSTVKQNAENARQANQLSAGASEIAIKGGAVVGQVVSTMSSINESSKKIADIIGVIDGIAFQTNILALNAAVEAARAGEQGRGFAVVASEVRNLAQRSAAAAKEIKELIHDSVDKVSAGTKLVDEAGQTMQEIVSSVKRVNDIMSEITAASQEQSSGIEQVNQAITQMDEVTQQNSALVEEAAAAAESLEEQAMNLAQAVAMFRLANQGAQLPVAKAVANVTELPARKKLPTATQRQPGRRVAVQAASAGEWTEF